MTMSLVRGTLVGSHPVGRTPCVYSAKRPIWFLAYHGDQVRQGSGDREKQGPVLNDTQKCFNDMREPLISHGIRLHTYLMNLRKQPLVKDYRQQSMCKAGQKFMLFNGQENPICFRISVARYTSFIMSFKPVQV